MTIISTSENKLRDLETRERIKTILTIAKIIRGLTALQTSVKKKTPVKTSVKKVLRKQYYYQ